MPIKASDKCRQCSKLCVDQAIARHGESGDGCWVGELCHKRRTYYKKRDLYNRNRRLKYRGEKESAAQLDSTDIPIVPAVIVYFYRQRKDEPLHALSMGVRPRHDRVGIVIMHCLKSKRGLHGRSIVEHRRVTGEDGGDDRPESFDIDERRKYPAQPKRSRMYGNSCRPEIFRYRRFRDSYRRISDEMSIVWLRR